MEKKLILQDLSGTVLRAYHIDLNEIDQSIHVIRRSDTRRLELVTSTENLEKKKINFERLGNFERGKPFLVGNLGELTWVENINETIKDEKTQDRKDNSWLMVLLALLIFTGGFLGYLLNRTPQTERIEAALKKEVVRIVKEIRLKPKVDVQQIAKASTENIKEKTTPTTKKTVSLKRTGALAALGSLLKSKQRAGVDLGAVNTTAGPGLGGTQGSGGVQTSLYGKGIVSAPLGSGANIQGAGGYGTKGKGGGQAGYGKLENIGSSGVSSIPLTQEATVAEGLDRDQIAAVINRNLGQVRFCYEQGLQGNPSLNGRVAVNFTIAGNGIVKTAGIQNTTLNSKEIEDCILLRLKTWQFPLPQGGAEVKVSYPFNLRRTGQG